MKIYEWKTQKSRKRINSYLPIVLLILVSLCFLLTENRDGGFVPGGFYSNVSVHGITLSKNLINSEHPLFMYTSKELQSNKIVYEAYNRFPVFPFLLTGLLTYPFEYNFTLQIYIARQLMNIFFLFSIIIIFKLISELTKNKYLALSITLITFSSYYMLTYNDLIFNDIPALLGFSVAMYCVVLAQKKKLKTSQILFYSLFPVSLGWQPFGVYVAWFMMDALESLFLNGNTSVRMRIKNFSKQASFRITGFSVLWGFVILGLQLFNEWRIVGGSFMHIPSLESALWRSGLNSATGHTQFTWLFDWSSYLPAQAHSITLMLIPFWPIFQVEPGVNAPIFIVISFIIYALLKYLKNKNQINKINLIMIFSGLFWAILMKQFVAMHEFQSIFYLGIIISIYLTLLSGINPKVWKILTLNITIVFLITVSLSNHLKTPNFAVNQITMDFQNIRNQLPVNSRVYFDGDREQTVAHTKFAVDFFLAGCLLTQEKDADYVISKDLNFNGKKLTSNPKFNLFRISNNH